MKNENSKVEAKVEVKQVNINGVNVDNSTKLKYQDSNPKRKNSKAHSRFEVYMKAKTVGEFYELGGTRGDLRYDADKEFVEITPTK